MWVYLLVAVASMVVAFLIARAVESSGLAKTKTKMKTKNGEYLGSEIIFDASLRKAISDELGSLVDSASKKREITRTISNALAKELEKRVNQSKNELDKKYSKLIDDKEKSEEIALRKYSKVLTEKKSTEAVLRSIAEGLVVVDSQGKVIMINPAAEKLLGTSKKDKVGKPILEDLKKEQLISLVKGSPDKDNREIELISQEDETKKVLRASTAVIENENGQTVGMVSVLSDITKQKELDRLKSKFVASVSHELRTPLVAVEKSITLLLGKTTGPISSTQEEFLSIAERNLKRLTNLINDLLDMSKLEAGKLQLNRQPSSIEEVIDEVNLSFDNWAKTKAIKFSKNIQKKLPQVEIDPQRMIQVFNNLVGNAIKFTPFSGEIIIGASLEDNCIKISVKDTGPGIPEKDLSKIFDKFYQVSERPHSDMGGTGLGLSIAKEIVELHGGKIWAESDKGQSATFIFTLPLKVIL